MDVKDIERSIIKKYKSKIYGRFLHGVKEFEMISNGDKIAVCISGGKDSFLLAKCMQELKRHSKYDFDLVFIVMNPGYEKKNLDLIKKNLKVPYLLAPAHLNRQRAGAVAVLGIQYAKEGKLESAMEHQPDYLRLSQAERERAQKQARKEDV